MSIEGFEDDALECAALLEHARRKGRIGKWLTLGLWSNDAGITQAERLLADAQSDVSSLRKSVSEVKRLRGLLNEWVVECGVRVARYAFPDAMLDGRQTYGPEWQLLRSEILERDSYTCRHLDGACRGALQIHHIVWLSQGGSNDPTNLITLCRFHHGEQHPGNPYFEDA